MYCLYEKISYILLEFFPSIYDKHLSLPLLHHHSILSKKHIGIIFTSSKVHVGVHIMLRSNTKFSSSFHPRCRRITWVWGLLFRFHATPPSLRETYSAAWEHVSHYPLQRYRRVTLSVLNLREVELCIHLVKLLIEPSMLQNLGLLHPMTHLDLRWPFNCGHSWLHQRIRQWGLALSPFSLCRRIASVSNHVALGCTPNIDCVLQDQLCYSCPTLTRCLLNLGHLSRAYFLMAMYHHKP